MGHVGSLVAHGCLLHPSIRNHLDGLNIIDIDEKRVSGEISDLTQMKEMLKECGHIRITSHPISESDIYIFTAGMTSDDREKVYEVNSKIVKDYLEKIQHIRKKNSLVIMATNPSHKMAQLALEYMPLVIPTGDLLDNARLRLCKACGKHEKPNIQAKYLEVRENKGWTNFAPSTEILIRIVEYIYGSYDKEDCF